MTTILTMPQADDFGKGLSVRTIAERMTEEGRPTKSGGRWHPTTVQRILARARA
jgi:hypothetical protein